MAIKVVNPGGISAFKFNARNLDLDEAHPYYGVTPRRVIQALVRAVHELGVTHPLGMCMPATWAYPATPIPRWPPWRRRKVGPSI